jgi:hypothetical protein
MPIFEEITPTEASWIAARLSDAAHLCAVSGVESLTPELLDGAWTAGLSDPASGDANFLINAIGIAFGQVLVDRLGFRWVIATDDYGTDLAVVAAEGNGDVLVYPANFVAKRFETRSTGFLAESIGLIAAELRRITGS